MKKSILFLALGMAVLFGAQQVQAKQVVLDKLKNDYTAQNGDTLTGTLNGESNRLKIDVAHNAKVVLYNMTINGYSKSTDELTDQWAGISCMGDATLVLVGNNKVTHFGSACPAIWIKQGYTLTIQGDGLLVADAKRKTKNSFGGAGIGGGFDDLPCGNIVINSGTIEATGCAYGAGIGSGYYSSCGSITINGGTVRATGGYFCAGIGCGTNGNCGAITINKGAQVTAIAGYLADYSIGRASGAGTSSCGVVVIDGEAYPDGISKETFIYPAVCATPTNVTASEITLTSAKISWTWPVAVAAKKFYVRYYPWSRDTYFDEVETTSKSYTLTNLEPNERYFVYVVSECNDGSTSYEYDAKVVFETKAPMPAPTNVKVTNVGQYKATIDWTPGNSEQNKWEVSYNDGYTTKSFTIESHPIGLGALTPETHYTVKVRAVSDFEKGLWSSEVTFNTPTAPNAEIYAAGTTTMTIYYDNKKSSRTGVIDKWTPGSGAISMPEDKLAAVKAVKIDDSMKNAAPASLDHWFSNMPNLTSFISLDYLNTSRVTTMIGMFNECTSLTSLDLSTFETSNVVYMNDMFSGCTGLQTLDLTNFTTTKVQDMSYMFYGCSALTTIVCDNDWSMASASSGSMFLNCTSLQGSRGTVYNSNEIGRWYAHPDGGVSNPGYFTTYKVSEEDMAAAKEDLMQWITLATEISEILNQSGETAGAKVISDKLDYVILVYNYEGTTIKNIDAQIVALDTELSKWKATILAYYQQQTVAQLTDLLEEGDSEACQKIIANAIKAVNALTWNDSKPFPDAYEELLRTLNEIYIEATIDLFAQRKKEASTAIEEVSQEPKFKSQKLFRDGQLYLMYEGRMYDVRGAEVK